LAVDESRLVLASSVRLIGKGCWAPDYPYALQASQYDAWRSSSSANGVALPGSTPSRRAFLVISRRGLVAGLLRAASSPGGIWAVLKALRDTDVRHLLPRVSVPTLVLHRRNDRAVAFLRQAAIWPAKSPRSIR